MAMASSTFLAETLVCSRTGFARSFAPLNPRVKGLNPRIRTKIGAKKKGVSSECKPLPPDRPVWFPGSPPPPWLDGSLPGDFGFDPLGLGSDPETLRWFAQAELVHSRWAMLAVFGILIPELLAKLDFLDENYFWIEAGSQQYFTDTPTLFATQMILMAWAEGRRWADFLRPGCVDTDPKFPNRENPKKDVGYPGGLWFDPLMWGRGSPFPVMDLRTKEIKNGRLAMLAFVGFWFQNPKKDVGYPGGLWFDPLMWGRGPPFPVMDLRTKEIKNVRLAMLAFVGFWFQNLNKDVGYLRGLWFDPLMWGCGSPFPVMDLRTKEIKNGRLAMLAFVRFWVQAIYTGEGPLDNLSSHLADPGHCNIFSAFVSK